MNPESFDLPYAPFISAFRSIGRVVLIAGAICLLLSTAFALVNRWGPFAERGPTLLLGPEVSGCVGGGISLQVQGLSVQYPGEAGVFYHARSYVDPNGRAEIITTRYEVDEAGRRHSPTVTRVSSER